MDLKSDNNNNYNNNRTNNDYDNDYDDDADGKVSTKLDPAGFTIRHPPAPHELDGDITPEHQLFQTSHMGVVNVVDDVEQYRLVIDGCVCRRLSLSLAQIRALPRTSVTAFHECYGSPLDPPPKKALWRVGNVRWTGVKLSTVLDIAGLIHIVSQHQEGVKEEEKVERYVWSQGLDKGTFADIVTTPVPYRKDLPLSKAIDPRVLLAYEMNGRPLTPARGFPLRLVVPGWFGTNSTKWLCRLSVRESRAPGPFTTLLYNERHVELSETASILSTMKVTKPVWSVDVNSMICHPRPGQVFLIHQPNDIKNSSSDDFSDVDNAWKTTLKGEANKIRIWGRAWAVEGVAALHISLDEGVTWSAVRSLDVRNGNLNGRVWSDGRPQKQQEQEQQQIRKQQQQKEKGEKEEEYHCEWQRFETDIDPLMNLRKGDDQGDDQKEKNDQKEQKRETKSVHVSIMVRAMDRNGLVQPLHGARNHVHRVVVQIVY